MQLVITGREGVIQEVCPLLHGDWGGTSGCFDIWPVGRTWPPLGNMSVGFDGLPTAVDDGPSRDIAPRFLCWPCEGSDCDFLDCLAELQGRTSPGLRCL